MNNYSLFAQYYDAIMGDRTPYISLLQQKINKFANKHPKILELGSGTGSLIIELAKNGDCLGIDYSDEMLEIARAKKSTVRFIKGDITNFETEERFDVIICVFETMNNLSSLKECNSLFKSCTKSLNKGGIIIFDMFTEHRLENLHTKTIINKETNDLKMALEITTNLKALKAEWFFKIKDLSQSINQEFLIKGRTYSKEKIKKMIDPFKILDVQDFKNANLPLRHSERLIYVLALK